MAWYLDELSYSFFDLIEVVVQDTGSFAAHGEFLVPFPDIIPAQIRLTAGKQLFVESPTTVLTGGMIATLDNLHPEPMTEKVERHVHEDIVGVIFATGLCRAIQRRWVVLNNGTLNVATLLGEGFVVLRFHFAFHFWRQHVNGGAELHVFVRKHAAKNVIAANKMNEAFFVDDARLQAAGHANPVMGTVSHGFPKALTLGQKCILNSVAYCRDLDTFQSVFANNGSH